MQLLYITMISPCVCSCHCEPCRRCSPSSSACRCWMPEHGSQFNFQSSWAQTCHAQAQRAKQYGWHGSTMTTCSCISGVVDFQPSRQALVSTTPGGSLIPPCTTSKPLTSLRRTCLPCFVQSAFRQGLQCLYWICPPWWSAIKW